MIFIVLVVLIRKGSQKDEDWDDEDYYDDDDLEEHSEEINTEVEETDSAEPQTEHSDAVQTVQESAEHIQPEIADDVRQELATKAGQVGVMQAAPGTSQGDTGWYVDANTELQYWNVGSDGSWTRVQ